MLGKASEIKTVSLESSGLYDIDERINYWLQDNESVTIIDIKFGFAMTEDERATSALIIYKEANNNAQTK